MSSHPITLVLRLTLMAALAIVVVGGARAFMADAPVAKEFTEDDFKKVTSGMPAAKVAELLGKPQETYDLPEPLVGKALFYESKGKYYGVAIGKDAKVLVTAVFSDKAQYLKALKEAKEAK